MGRLWLVGFAVSAMLALGACTAVAGATTPATLILSGSVTELEAKLTGGTSKLETEKGKTITSGSVEAELLGCEELEKKPTDTNLCKDVPVTFKETKLGEVGCRSENAKGEKAAAETVSALLDLHLDSAVVGGELVPLLVSKMLGTALEAEVTVVCGSLKEKIKGRLGCVLTPGLTNVATNEKLKVDCRIKKGSKGIQEVGECIETKVLCEELKNDPFLADLSGSGTFEKSAMELHVEGSPSKDVFIDD